MLILPLFISSSVMIVISIILSVYSMGRSHNAPQFTNAELEEKIDRTFLALSGTQKFVIRYVYKLHKTDVSLEELFKGLNKKIPGVIGSMDELYFRIMVLVQKELLSTKAVESRVTVVTSIPKVGYVLDKLGRMVT
jgi:hypothetical protein